MPIPTVTDLTTDEELAAIHALPRGTIIHLSGQFERSFARLNDTKPFNVTYVYVRPGTSHYTLYGADHVVKI